PGRLLDVRGAVLGDGMGDTVPVPAAVPGRPALGGQAQAPSPPGGRRGTARSPTVVPRRALAEADPGPPAGRPQALSRRVIPAGRSPRSGGLLSALDIISGAICFAPPGDAPSLTKTSRTSRS